MADLRGEEFVEHVPQTRLLALLVLVMGLVLPSRGELALEGEWLCRLKDWIDRKWMWQYTGGLPSLDDEEGCN